MDTTQEQNILTGKRTLIFGLWNSSGWAAPEQEDSQKQTNTSLSCFSHVRYLVCPLFSLLNKTLLFPLHSLKTFLISLTGQNGARQKWFCFSRKRKKDIFCLSSTKLLEWETFTFCSHRAINEKMLIYWYSLLAQADLTLTSVSITQQHSIFLLSLRFYVVSGQSPSHSSHSDLHKFHKIC